MASNHFDIVQLGAGWAGSISATRLARETKFNILVLDTTTNQSVWKPGYSWQMGDVGIYEQQIASRLVGSDRWSCSHIWNTVYPWLMNNGISIYPNNPCTLTDRWNQFCQTALGGQYCIDLNSFNKQFHRYGRENRNIHKDGTGSTAENDYLIPEADKNDRLTLLKRVQIEKLIFDEHKVVSVIYEIDNTRYIIDVSNSIVILSLGVIGNAQLLKISGIGPRRELEKHGIDVVIDNPHVGAHLKDGLISWYIYSTNAAINSFEEPTPRPAVYMTYRNKKYLITLSPLFNNDKFEFKLTVFPLEQNCDGTVELTGSKMSDHVNIDYKQDFNFVVNENEKVLQYISELLSTSQLKQVFDLQLISSDVISNSRYINHLTGTTRLAINEDHGVADINQKVFGIDNLYVSSNSIYPYYTGAGGQTWGAIAGYNVADSIIDRLQDNNILS